MASGMGNRSQTQHAQPKNRVPREVPEVEYELGNGDLFSQHVSESESDEESNHRIIMMYDEQGNATPMPMAKFYYDSVQHEVDSQRLAAEEAEEDLSQDTTRSDVPAPLTKQYSSSTSSSSSAASEDVDIEDPNGKNFVQEVDDQEFEEDKDTKKEEPESDPFQNQFMRIQIAATGLKDVSRVRKDMDHDKPHRKSTFRAGLQRAVSTVKIDKSRAGGPVAAKQMSNRGSSAGGLQRMLSYKRSKSVSLQENDQEGSLQRNRDNSAAKPTPVRRQGLAGIGRMISINKQKPPSSRTSGGEKGGILPAPTPGRVTEDRPRTSQPISSTSSIASSKPGRASLSQVGRLLSRNKKKTAIPVEKPEDGKQDRQRREPESSTKSSRMGLSKIGRVLSFNRQKPAIDSSKLSPLSASSVSTSGESPASAVSAESGDRVRGMKKQSSRMKVSTRMLSFSRKPQRSRTLMTESDPKRSQNAPPKTEGVEGSKLDGRGDKFFFSDINSEKVRQTGLLEEPRIRVPVIALAEYSGPVSRTKWYVDGFTLPHNAVRRECIDLYDILIGMARCKGNTDICKDDMDDFEDWWKVASNFLDAYFNMERRVIFPWVDAAGGQDWEVQLALKKMRSMKDKLQEQLHKIDRVWNEKTFKPVGEMFVLVYKAVDELVPRLMNYFADQEVLLPAIVKGYYRLDDRLKMDKDMLNCFMGDSKEKEAQHHNLILLIRWISNARQLRAWIGKNLNSSARSSYARWYAMYEEDHLRIVKQVRNRSKQVQAV